MDSRQVRKPGAADPTREMRPSGSYRVQLASAEDNLTPVYVVTGKPQMSLP